MGCAYWNNTIEYLNDLEDETRWCICNNEIPSLYRLLLQFSYIYNDCNKCFSSRYHAKYRKHVYEYADEDKCKLDLENEDQEEILIQIKNIIKKNPKILYEKVNGITPLEFINKLDKILDIEDTHPFLKHREHCEIRRNQHSLNEILQFEKFEYLKYEIIKTVACKSIKNSNHNGADATQLQLPLHIWEEIFTFI